LTNAEVREAVPSYMRTVARTATEPVSGKAGGYRGNLWPCLAAAEGARRVEGYRALHDLLRLWRLTAIAHSDPGFDVRLERAREAARTGSTEGWVPIEDIVPDWADRLRHR
jgi:hypothetical protein